MAFVIMVVNFEFHVNKELCQQLSICSLFRVEGIVVPSACFEGI
jgi:hypothetical protein